MAKRLFDFVFSLTILIILAPVLLLVALIIKLSSRGPIFYVAERAGLNGRPIKVYKFRSMHVLQDLNKSKITATNDPRIFKFGSFLRKSKIDELPQFINVFIGNMSVVGPRPEDISIVENSYGELGHSTLVVKPGIASPGSLFNYTHAQNYLDDNEPEVSYIERLLPVKLGIEKVYVDDSNLVYDVSIILRTIVTIIYISLGKKEFNYPKEYEKAKDLGYFEVS